MKINIIAQIILSFTILSCTRYSISGSDLKKSSAANFRTESENFTEKYRYSRSFSISAEIVWDETGKDGRTGTAKEKILISGSDSSGTSWWAVLYAVLFTPSKFLVPFYLYENKGIHISSASGKEKTVGHSIKSEFCFGILVFNCAFFEGFESEISANRRLKEEIYPALLEDYLVRTGKIPEKK
ncbi:MAG TPA: hypothetical protein PKN56_26440 [Leptospiraceae bacterium]|nr:hypothetical protein [Leptospiraceae bacterium]HMY69828.1 hypothetical protein [Leptospiraceae bacterium]HNF27987.1 hypothetical protein [Leptospiraceae bacterium]HNI97715.1 hypothetical protein [Leptospiraceae bacterium]HNN07121.1 hypothetical protein [Leptospiraceae bacterium]